MLATFCLRLACGLAGALLLLSPAQVNQRFYRVQFLTVLGLLALAAVSLSPVAGAGLWLAVGGSMVCAFLGSLLWSLDEAPGGRVLVGLTAAATALTLCVAGLVAPGPASPPEAEVELAAAPPAHPGWQLADDLSSAALLGSATTAMLMGHSYLIAPTMSLTPLLRLLGGLAAATLVRMALAACGLWSWTVGHSLTNLEDETVLWLPLRWGLGFAAPLVLGWMAWQTTKIRSTQSATGILYVVVIFCFLGELTSQVLQRNTGYYL